MWNEKNVTGSIHVKFEVICGLEQMLEDDILTYFEMLLGLEQIP
jgi:hypothetical protein